MILKRYGERVQSVRPNFDARAMTEIGFRRDDERTMGAADFEHEWVRTAGHELTAAADGPVQAEAEEAVLADLLAQLERLETAADAAGEVLLIENVQGRNQAKTVGRQNTVIVGFENRLHFDFRIEPPLVVGVYARSGGP